MLRCSDVSPPISPMRKDELAAFRSKRDALAAENVRVLSELQASTEAMKTEREYVLVPKEATHVARVARSGKAMFVHYSRQPFRGPVKDSFQIGGRADRGDKPNGLWFSVEGRDDGWRQWCEAENFNVDALAHQTEIVFRDDAKLLCLSSAGTIDIFTHEYGTIPPYAVSDLYQKGDAIDWPRVAEEYEGIIISPYCWRARLDTRWYYGWDCASGVVWCARAVAELRPIATLTSAREATRKE